MARSDGREQLVGRSAGALVLLYHRVGLPGRDPWTLTVSPERFADHMATVAELGEPTDLGDLARAVATGDVPRTAAASIAVTFDDGYADCLAYAVPELERRKVPATFFIPTDGLDDNREFWWDELERLVFGGASLTSAGAGAASPADTYQDLWQSLLPLPSAERERALAALRGSTGQDGVARSGYRRMTSEELRQLASRDCFRIGAHSVTHSRLAGLPEAEQRREILDSRATLEAITGRPVTVFAYPFGTPGDYTATTVDLVREAGYHAACANAPGVVTGETDCYQLPRLFVQNWDRAEFSSRVEQALSATEPTSAARLAE